MFSRSWKMKSTQQNGCTDSEGCLWVGFLCKWKICEAAAPSSVPQVLKFDNLQKNKGNANKLCFEQMWPSLEKVQGFMEQSLKSHKEVTDPMKSGWHAAFGVSLLTEGQRTALLSVPSTCSPKAWHRLVPACHTGLRRSKLLWHLWALSCSQLVALFQTPQHSPWLW